MPINRGSHISAVIEEVKHLNPQSILDVGCGAGLMGSVFRAYTDIRLSELRPERYHTWETVIHGIEVFEDYRNPLWESYNHVYIGEAIEVLKSSDNSSYDLIYAGDVLEHFTKDKGFSFIDTLLKHGKTILIATPSPAPAQPALLGNAYEEHLSSWDEFDFVQYDFQVVGNFNGILLIKLHA